MDNGNNGNGAPGPNGNGANGAVTTVPTPEPRIRGTIKPVRTMHEFVAQWDLKLERIIRSFKLSEYAEDLKQEIYTRIHVNKGLENYDVTKGSFSTYVYAVVLTIVYNFRKQKNRERATMPISLDDPVWDQDGAKNNREERVERGRYSERHMENIRLDVDKERTFQLQLKAVRKKLSRMSVRSAFRRDGEVVTRDLASLFDMILEGKSREEMCTHFQYSSGSVGILFEELRKVPEVMELKDLWGK